MKLYLRSALFLVWFIAVSVLMNVGALPVLLLPFRFALNADLYGGHLFLNFAPLTYQGELVSHHLARFPGDPCRGRRFRGTG